MSRTQLSQSLKAIKDKTRLPDWKLGGGAERRRTGAATRDDDGVDGDGWDDDDDVDGGRLARERANARRVERLRAMPMRGECGSSRYARSLRAARRAASTDARERDVVVIGEAGTMRLDVAKLIHFGSPRRRAAAAAVDCGRLAAFGETRVFGGNYDEGARREALESAVRAEEHATGVITKAFRDVGPGGALILRDVDLLPLQTRRAVNEALKAQRANDGGTDRSSRVRVVITSSASIPEVLRGMDTDDVMTIRIPPLRVRRADVEAEAHFFMRRAEMESDDPVRYDLSEDGVRALQAHDWPGNEDELETVLKRAMVQLRANRVTQLRSRDGEADDCNCQLITKQVLWPNSKSGYGGWRRGTNFRLNLFSALPWTRTMMRSELWNGGFQSKVVIPAFALVNLALLLGPQSRDSNVFLNIFWAWWWPGILITYPLVGRLWCAFCPFMAVGTKAQEFAIRAGWPMRSWPHETMERYGGWALVSLFAVILLWEELWALEDHAALSSGLLLLITSGAVIGSVFFEKRIWCRYVCPIGGMNGMFAKISGTEIRAEQGVCSAQCSSYGCFKGGPAVPPDGMETSGCPVGIHPAQIKDNHDCVLCGSCVQACPHSSVRLNLRPPGIDLWTTNQPVAHEAALLFLLLGASFCHRLPELADAFGASPEVQEAIRTTASSTSGDNAFASEPFVVHTIAAFCALAFPSIVAFSSHALGRISNAVVNASSERETPPQPFVKEAYAYLPLCWLALLAHFLDLGMGEAGRVLPVAARTFGLSALADNAGLPSLVADDHVISFCQGIALIAGASWSLVLLRYNASRPWLAVAPQSVSILCIAGALWRVVVVAQ